MTTGYPKNFPGQIQVGIIAGGDINDKPTDHSCNQKVYSPLEHSPDGVKLEHLAFSPMNHSPTNHSQQHFPGALDPGTLVYVLKNTGQNQVTILGQANDLHNSSTNRIEGNLDLFSNPIVNELFNRTIKVNIPPDVREAEVNGAKVKIPKEKDKEHAHNLLKGIPTHGALFDMSGFRLPQVKEVPTALQDYQKLMTNGMLGGMPGDVMSLGKMFQGLMGGMGGGAGGGGGGAGGGAGSVVPVGTGQVKNSLTGTMITGSVETADVSSASQLIDASQFKPSSNSDIAFERVLHKVPENMRNAMTSMATLIQGTEGGGSLGSYPTSARVHSETFLGNAEDLLGQVRTVDDMMIALHQLQWDESLFGLDKLQPIQLVIDTTYGQAQQYVYANGLIDILHTPESMNLQNSFSNTMNTSGITTGGSGGGGGGGGSPGAAGSGSMFGDVGGKLQEMFKRMSPEAEKKMKEVIEKTNTSQDAKKITGIVQALMNGQNPVKDNLFQSGGGGGLTG